MTFNIYARSNKACVTFVFVFRGMWICSQGKLIKLLAIILKKDLIFTLKLSCSITSINY